MAKRWVALDPEVLDRAARAWAAQQSRDEPAAIEGKCICGAARHNPGAEHHLVAAVEHQSGVVLGQEAVADKTSEIPAVRTLLLIDLQRLDWERPQVCATEHRTSEKGHGREEQRSCRVIDLSAHPDIAPLPHRPVIFRIEHERRLRKTGEVQHETVHGLTSLPPDKATAELVLALVRGHWSIENRLHHVRDVSYDEDQCQVRTGHLPRNLACLTNRVISIVRLRGRFDHLPKAHRYYAKRAHDAVRHLHEPPKR